MSPIDPSPDQQRDVQRLLGRCMLRIQQYEQLLKAMLAAHELTGTVETWEAEKAARATKVSGDTLGLLAKALFESLVVVDGAEHKEILDDDRVPNDRISFGVRFTISLSPERRDAMHAAIAAMVATRNDLVHHLIEKFDVWSDTGCVAAVEHLTRAYEEVDQRYEELRGWARTMEEARRRSAEFARSETFQALLVDGIAPDGSIDWNFSGIVRVLREGFQRNAVEGWAPLNLVCIWASEHHPEQTPERYQCRGWPHVLHESRLFQMEYRKSESGAKEMWFRERENSVRRPTDSQVRTWEFVPPGSVFDSTDI